MPKTCDVFPNENLSYVKSMNVSPELSWSGAPAGTQSYAILLEDVTINQAHWVIWNIAGSVSTVAANIHARQRDAGDARRLAAGQRHLRDRRRLARSGFVLQRLPVRDLRPVGRDVVSTQATDAGQIRTQLRAMNAPVLGSAILEAAAIG